MFIELPSGLRINSDLIECYVLEKSPSTRIVLDMSQNGNSIILNHDSREDAEKMLLMLDRTLGVKELYIKKVF